MKRFACLAFASLACLFMFACTDDDDNKEAKNACEYLVPLDGTSSFEFDLNYSEIKNDAKKVDKAMDLCIDELNSLPSCKNVIIDMYSCEADVAKGKLSTEEYDKAVLACADATDDTCEKDANKKHPCYEKFEAEDDCWMKLSEADADATNKYIQNYRSKYNNL